MLSKIIFVFLVWWPNKLSEGKKGKQIESQDVKTGKSWSLIRGALGRNVYCALRGKL